MPNKTARTRKLAGRSSAALLLQRVEHWHRLHNGPTVMNGDAWAPMQGKNGRVQLFEGNPAQPGLITAPAGVKLAGVALRRWH